MRESGWTPSIVPAEADQTVYIVLDDFGRNGRAYRETDVERVDLEAVIMDMLEGQYQNPVRVIGFTTAEKWSQDVSGDVAHELRRHCHLLPSLSVACFGERPISYSTRLLPMRQTRLRPCDPRHLNELGGTKNIPNITSLVARP